MASRIRAAWAYHLNVKIALEASCLAAKNRTGIARYSAELLAAFEQECMGADDELTLLVQARRLRRKRQIPARTRADLCGWIGKVWPLSKPWQLVHAADHRLPPWQHSKRVVTIHDMFAAVGVNFENADARNKQIALYHDLAARADFVICVSTNSQQDFLRTCRFDAARTQVVHLGVGSQFHPRPAEECGAFRTRYALPRPYLLFVGNIHHNKNLRGVVSAYAQVAAGIEHDLLVVGRSRGEALLPVQEQLAAAGLSKRVHFAGSIADADIPLAYAAASGLLFPSRYEGFGLPILEAMASGIPVLTSNTSSCPEVAGGHAVLVNPEDVEAIADGIHRVLARSPAQHAEARAYALTKTWGETARQTWAVYRQLLG